jgi:hypothetical protein
MTKKEWAKRRIVRKRRALVDRPMKIKPGKWWALLNHKSDLPVLFSSRSDALENRMDDEYLVRVQVDEAQP